MNDIVIEGIKTRGNYRELQMEFTESVEWFCDRISDKISVG